MGNILIIIILLLVLGAAILPTFKHFKGQGGCCGGGSYKPQKKKLNHVSARKTFRIEGMHCENCSNRVMETLNDIPGVSAAVNLKKGTALVSYETMIEDSVICEKIAKAGYTAAVEKISH